MQDEHPEEFGGGGSQVAGARDRRSQGRGCQRDADHNRWSHDRTGVYDRREGQRHDQGGLERFRFVKRVGSGRKEVEMLRHAKRGMRDRERTKSV